MSSIGVPFEMAIVAGEIASYKPSHRHWEVFDERTGADPSGHVHVAQSLYHDIGPATELGIASIWINRLGEPDDPRPTVMLRGLTGLADELDRLVAAEA
jgi:FMN phosphatase YigB (HAD superfamily)